MRWQALDTATSRCSWKGWAHAQGGSAGVKLVLCLPSDSKASHFWNLQVFFPLNQRFASLQGKRLNLALKKKKSEKSERT